MIYLIEDNKVRDNTGHCSNTSPSVKLPCKGKCEVYQISKQLFECSSGCKVHLRKIDHTQLLWTIFHSILFIEEGLRIVLTNGALRFLVPVFSLQFSLCTPWKRHDTKRYQRKANLIPKFPLWRHNYRIFLTNTWKVLIGRIACT